MACKTCVLLATLYALPFAHCWASKLVSVRPMDATTLMVHFKDSEVWNRDDGKGPTANRYDRPSKEDEALISHGEPLATDVAQTNKSWTLIAPDGDALQPVAVHRKTKVWGTTAEWEPGYQHWLFLRLDAPLINGQTYDLQVAPETNSDSSQYSFTYNDQASETEAIHINRIGYQTSATTKSADLYLWMGDGGPRDYSAAEGRSVMALNLDTLAVHEAGQVTFWQPQGVDTEANQRDLTGSPVWRADCSAITTPGRYRIYIEGIGCSPEFEVSDDIYAEPFRYSILGYYYMRIGEANTDIKPLTRRPLFIPGESPKDFVVYKTDLHPFHPEWIARKGDTWDEPHHKPAKNSIFWKHRLPGNPTNPKARGGHSDALDWDRRLLQVSSIYDILLPYLLTDGALNQDNLGIAESGNGIPDIIDEARYSVDFWLSLRDERGYGHGVTNPGKEENCMFQAGPTALAAWANALNCAMLAEAFRLSGHEQERKFYQAASIEAFEFASAYDDPQLDAMERFGDTRGRDFRMMAAAYLFNLTGEPDYETIMAEEALVTSPTSEIRKENKFIQLWGVAAYLKTPHTRNYPELANNMQAAIAYQAMRKNLEPATTRPSRRATNVSWWQSTVNLQRLMIAHATTNDPELRTRLVDAMQIDVDWGLGRNPSNMVEMTGLGSRHVVNCYTTGRNDGALGVHPGHTPYMNLGSWGGTHRGSNPSWFTKKCYPQWEEGKWPHQEGHFDSRYSWANAEFTPQQTMRGKVAAYGYLHALSAR